MEATTPHFLVDVPLTTEVNSEPFAAYGLRWRLRVFPGEQVGFYLDCLGGDNDNGGESWSCQARAELRIINHSSIQSSMTRSIRSSLFDAEKNPWGFSKFVMWAHIADPKEGYVRDGKVTFEATIVVDEVRLGKAANVVALILSKPELQEKLSKSDRVKERIQEGEKKVKEIDDQIEGLQSKRRELVEAVEADKKDPDYLPEKAAKKIRLELTGIRQVAKAVGKVADDDDDVAEALGRRVDTSCPICFQASRGEMRVFGCPKCHKWFCGECRVNPAVIACCPHCRADFGKGNRPRRNIVMERLLN